MNKRKKAILLSKIEKLDELILVGLDLFIQKRESLRLKAGLPKRENVDREIEENYIQKSVIYDEIKNLCQN